MSVSVTACAKGMGEKIERQAFFFFVRTAQKLNWKTTTNINKKKQVFFLHKFKSNWKKKRLYCCSSKSVRFNVSLDLAFRIVNNCHFPSSNLLQMAFRFRRTASTQTLETRGNLWLFQRKFNSIPTFFFKKWCKFQNHTAIKSAHSITIKKSLFQFYLLSQSSFF